MFHKKQPIYFLFLPAVSIHPSKYLNYLLNQFVSSGGVWEKKTINNFQEVFEKGTDVVINCSGLGAKELVEEDDEKNKLFPIGGQVVIAKMHLDKPIGFKFKRNEGQKTYFITRAKDENEEKYEVVLGGTYVRIPL